MPDDDVTLWFLLKVGATTAICFAILALISFGVVALMAAGQGGAVRLVAKLLRRKH
jgi:hypothetical protein